MSLPTTLTLVPGFLRAVATLLPVLVERIPVASPFVSVAEQILSAAAALVERGEDGYQELNALTQQIVNMGASEPTEEQWDDLRRRSDAAHAAIQAPEPAP